MGTHSAPGLTSAVRTHPGSPRPLPPIAELAGEAAVRAAGRAQVWPPRAARLRGLSLSCRRPQEAPGLRAAHLGARRPPGPELQLSPSQHPAPRERPCPPPIGPQPDRPAPRTRIGFLARPPPPLAHVHWPPSLGSASPHWLPARPAPFGAQVWAGLGGAEWPVEAGSTHLQSPRATRKREPAARGAACGRCLAPFPGPLPQKPPDPTSLPSRGGGYPGLGPHKPASAPREPCLMRPQRQGPSSPAPPPTSAAAAVMGDTGDKGPTL